MKASIICIGNRFMHSDSAGIAVYDILQKILPENGEINLIEGGMAGLNLLPFLEQGGRVVFVDAVAGFTKPGKIVTLTEKEIKGSYNQNHFDHEAGLAYLLTLLPEAGEGEPPEEIVMVGLEGACSATTIDKAARLCITMATIGLQELTR